MPDRSQLILALGAFLLLIGILGGGFEVREIKVPTVGAPLRVLAGALGAALLLFDLADHAGLVRRPDANPPAAIATTPPAAATSTPGTVATPPPPVPTATPEPTPRPTIVTFDDVEGRESQSEVLELPLGYHAIPADPSASVWIGQSLSTRCADHRITKREDYPVRTSKFNIARLLRVYILMHASRAWAKYRDRDIGSIELEFSGGGKHRLPLKLGWNIRDVRHEPPDDPEVVTSVRDPSVREFWRNRGPDGHMWGFDLLTVNVSEHLQGDTLTAIQLRDTSKELDDDDPCIEIKAITVMHRN